jgi:hypothetical protein
LSASGAAAGGDRRVGLDEFLVEFAELRLIGAQRCGRVGRVGGWCHECGGKQAGGQGAKAERTHSYPLKKRFHGARFSIIPGPWEAARQCLFRARGADRGKPCGFVTIPCGKSPA